MQVYEFDKCLSDRLEESLNVLSWKEDVIPPSKVQSEWAYYIELWVEPTGWQALWKIPRVICEEMQIRYPSVVFGMVEQVNYEELKASFRVEAVQEDDVYLAEIHHVALQDLYPTINQVNTELNIQRTADCLDRLRFFYTSVWMPWDNDNDEDFNWAEKHLHSRIRFCYDLRKGGIKRPVAAHIRTLLSEAKYIQQRREYIELDLSDDDDLNQTQKSQVTDLMRLHLRLAIIRNEIEMLENPEMRRIYEDEKFDENMCIKPQQEAYIDNQNIKTVSYMVMKPGCFTNQIEVLRLLEPLLPEKNLLQMCSSLQECFNICNASDHIFLAPGRHPMKFLEYLNGKGSIIGVSSKSQFSMHADEQNAGHVVVCSLDDDSILLVFDGDFTLKGLTLDCTNVRTGILIKNGNVRLEDCVLIGNSASSTSIGIQLSGDNSQLVLRDCVVQNFATGIKVKGRSKLSLQNNLFLNCSVALDVAVYTKALHFENTSIKNSSKCGIFLDSVSLNDTEDKVLILKCINDLKRFMQMDLNGECTFTNCKHNIYIINELKRIIPYKTLQNMFDDCETMDKECKSN